MPLSRDTGAVPRSTSTSLSVDVTQLPGYQPIPANCPLWKKAMVEKKSKQLEENAVRIAGSEAGGRALERHSRVEEDFDTGKR